MSFLSKRWVIQNERKDVGLLEKLLENRGINTPEEREKFFNEGLEGLHSPLLLKDMDKAVERIREAVKKGEKIMVFGDYDVDGITGAAILVHFLKAVGAKVDYTLPHREEDGYGLKAYFMERFAESGVKLVVTVDCGTANYEEVEIANGLGVDVVVTDHHSLPAQLPNAMAVVNPKREDCDYPMTEICGSTIAYKLVYALAPHYWDLDKCRDYLAKQMSIVVLGVIGDCMPMVGENRVLVREGLKSLRAGNNPGVMALLKEAGIDAKNVDSNTIGFQIGPRINAAGRLDTPDHAFELLLGDVGKAVTLNELNAERREVVKKFTADAAVQVQDHVEKHGEVPRIIVIHSPKWRAGTLGLIASKMADQFGRPTIAMQDKGEEFVASCRSVNDFDITGFLRREARELFVNFGGHKLAGGFTLGRENLEQFLNVVKEKSAEVIDPDNFPAKLEVDCEVAAHELSMDTCHEIGKLEPYGFGNPQPTLMVRGAKITSFRQVGQNGEHLQFPLEIAGNQVSAIAFRMGEHAKKLDGESEYDVAFQMEINEWMGKKKLQLKVVDVKPAE